ncbi:MAG: orotidine-5'-phosphate decarboxylase [Candidatus Zixiibacteriota bacterium]|nr:MAG: orotidine-5'-phosphate decarboxylase [candidate division Zixibacteria bacterium]
MSAVDKLTQAQDKNKSIICLGLDLDPRRMPAELSRSIKGMYDFTMKIIDATRDMVCAYKPNLAFYENKGPEGFSLLRSIVEHVPEDIVVILDGKRGDIGNTASFYAEALFKKLGADWVTLSPYMGYDSMRPFLEYEDKGIFVLCLTSNTGSKDFQHLVIDGKPLYQIVAEKVSYWNKEDNCGLVVGATQPEQLRQLRTVADRMPLLIPGVGAQGGSLEKAAVYGTDNFQKLAIINVCRSVLYASTGEDFAERARGELKKLNDIVSGLRTGEIQLDAAPSPAAEESLEEAPEEPAAPPPPEPPKKEWKLPPIPDLPFMRPKKEREEQNQTTNQPPPSDRPPDGHRNNSRDFRDRGERQHRDNRRNHNWPPNRND